MTLLRLRGLCNSSAVLATLKIFDLHVNVCHSAAGVQLHEIGDVPSSLADVWHSTCGTFSVPFK